MVAQDFETSSQFSALRWQREMFRRKEVFVSLNILDYSGVNCFSVFFETFLRYSNPFLKIWAACVGSDSLRHMSACCFARSEMSSLFWKIFVASLPKLARFTEEWSDICQTSHFTSNQTKIVVKLIRFLKKYGIDHH